MRSCEVSGTMKEVYSKAWFLGKEEEFKKCKGSSSWVQKENECKSKTTEEVKHS